MELQKGLWGQPRIPAGLSCHSAMKGKGSVDSSPAWDPPIFPPWAPGWLWSQHPQLEPSGSYVRDGKSALQGRFRKSPAASGPTSCGRSSALSQQLYPQVPLLLALGASQLGLRKFPSFHPCEAAQAETGGPRLAA